MAIQDRLADRLLTRHPEQAARTLERFPDEDVGRVLREEAPKVASQVLRRMVPYRGAAALLGLEPEAASAILAELDPGSAARLLRRAPEQDRATLLASLSTRGAAAVRRLLRFPENTAGALVDPLVLTVPPDMSVKDALRAAREAPEQARYHLYVLDRDQRLVGVLNFRELFLARGAQPVSAVMTTPVVSIPARADRNTILHHPGWRDVHALPVVDRHGVFIGVIRYRTLRRLEQDLTGLERAGQTPTAEALSDLFGAGVAALFGALAPGRSDRVR